MKTLKELNARKIVASVLAKEFARTGVIDCPRMATLVCNALQAAGLLAANVNKKGN